MLDVKLILLKLTTICQTIIIEQLDAAVPGKGGAV
jgi:hypothetical protein